jgi:hypothetical protein
MFELTEETRNNVIALLREKMEISHYTDDELNSIIDDVVSIVKQQFGF